MSDHAGLPRPSLASECTESMASRPLDGASAGGMPVGRVEFSPSPPAGFPADAAGAAMLIAKHFKVDPESRIAAAVAAERERIRLEMLTEASAADARAERAYAAGADRPGGPVNQAASSALREFARRLEGA